MKHNRSQATNFKLYTLNFGGNNIMSMKKNIVKAMQNIGEMSACIGSL